MKTTNFYQLLKQNLPEKNLQKEAMDKIASTVALGIRAEVLKNLKHDNKEEFEQIVNSNGDWGVFMFGMENIEGFEMKFKKIVDKVAKAALVDLN